MAENTIIGSAAHVESMTVRRLMDLDDVTISSITRGDSPVYDSTTGTFKNQSKGVFDVRDYGAKGDGATDDTAAIQAAIDACATAGGGSVVISACTANYLIKGTLLLKSGVRLVGSMYGLGSGTYPVPSVVHNPTIAGAHLFSNTDPVTDYLYGMGISGLRLYAAAGVNVGDAIHLTNPGVLCIDGVSIDGFDRGIWIAGAIYSLVTNCNIRNQTVVSIEVCSSTWISTTTRIRDTNVSSAPWGVIVRDDCSNIILENVIAQGCSLGAFDIFKGSDVVMDACYSENVPPTSTAKPIIQVGVSADSSTAKAILSLRGGIYGGINGTLAENSSFINADAASISIFGGSTARIDKVLVTTTNTGSVEIFGLLINQAGFGGADPWRGIYNRGKVSGFCRTLVSSGVFTADLRANGLRLLDNGTTGTGWQWIPENNNTDCDLVLSSYNGSALTERLRLLNTGQATFTSKVLATGGLGAGNSAAAGINETQTITIDATGGHWHAIFGGQTTAALDWNCTAAQLQTAFCALSSVGAGHATVTGGPGATAGLVVTFVGALGATDVGDITTDATTLTGGGGTASVVETLKGVVAVLTGPVVKKMEIFDATGTSLGYVAIYDAIT